ncbi:hypothetical protein EJ02DRAFT_449542 [Clathrospora elynae]|uniref:Extracellular membrane protein CFEM domain-containing protein n=1 Tax=Clathrospora elynae TaxID=706981 RepID=A0A6A5T534_9PLEO|nr:hypothetical protein EJ02DRAFT_449542 [Clathrospora elynae]
MVRISSAFALLLTIAVGAQAAAYCQCLYADSSHCCVADNIGDCKSTCMNAVPIFQSKACKAGGKYSNVSFFNAQARTGCKP